MQIILWCNRFDYLLWLATPHRRLLTSNINIDIYIDTTVPLGSGQFSRFALDILWPPLAAARAEAEAEKTGQIDGLFLLRGDAQSLPFKEKQLESLTAIARVIALNQLAVSLLRFWKLELNLNEVMLMLGYTPWNQGLCLVGIGYSQGTAWDVVAFGQGHVMSKENIRYKMPKKLCAVWEGH